MTARESAFLSLQKYEHSGVYPNIELSYAIERGGLVGAERALYTALFYGVIERKLTLDYYIEAVSSRPLGEIDGDVLVILRLGLYQLLYLSRIPESAAVNESVALARRFYAKKNSEGFVNAVLREFLRRRKTLSLPTREAGFGRYASVAYSVPVWICELWRDAYGEDTAERMLSTLDAHPTLTLSVNTLKTTRDALLRDLAVAGIDAEPSALCPTSVRLRNNTPMALLEPFFDRAFVQDETSALCALAVGAEVGDTVLDACACPGGKSFAMAIAMQNRGKILSRDLHKNKLSLIESGAARLGIDIIETGTQDASVRDESLPPLRKILCDVPCSGLGVLAKKPDIRYKKQEDIVRLPALQAEILDVSAGYLAVGGTLVYSTCTLNPAENRGQISSFLARHPSFSLCPFRVGALDAPDGILEVLPHTHGTDGFFIAKLKREA